MAQGAAEATYQNCLENASNSPNQTTLTCVAPCPNFCSFNGNCSSNGVCSCKSGYYGVDCSQQLVCNYICAIYLFLSIFVVHMNRRKSMIHNYVDVEVEVNINIGI